MLTTLFRQFHGYVHVPVAHIKYAIIVCKMFLNKIVFKKLDK